MRSLRPAVAVLFVSLLCPLPANASNPPELQWDPPTSGVAAGYLVWSGTSPGAYSGSVDVGPATVFVLPSLAEGTTYYFAVQAYDADSQLGALSTEVSLTTAPSAATNLAAAVRSRHRIDLNWQAPSGTVSGYRVEVGSTAGESDVATITTGTVPTLSMRSLPAGTYYARVRSVNIGGVSAPGNEVVATLVAAPPPPSNLVATVRRRRLIDLAWEAPTTAVLSYRIEVGTAHGRSDVRRVGTAGTTLRIDDLASGVYFIRVRSVDVVGAGSPSNEVTVELVR
jgi:predicted phage tail protein